MAKILHSQIGRRKALLCAAALAGAAALPASAGERALKSAAASKEAKAAAAPLVLQDQGSFTVGGGRLAHPGEFSPKRFLSPEGQRAYGDHAYVFYQKPLEETGFPIVFQHGGAQTKRTWESTLDGRDGFQNIFLRKSRSVYLVDQPRIGEAGLSLAAAGDANPYAKNPLFADVTLHELCRIGVFPGRFEHSQFPPGEAALEAFQRCWTPYAGALDDDVSADALAALFLRTGPAVLFTHSMGGSVGWRTPLRTENVRAIVAFEPGGAPFLFPAGEAPEPAKAVFEPVSAVAQEIPLEAFRRLARVPMLLIYGDNIAEKPCALVGPDKWRSELDMARKFVAAVNRHGGRAELLHLPDIGIRGNTHFLMSDLNNREIAELVDAWLKKRVPGAVKA